MIDGPNIHLDAGRRARRACAGRAPGTSTPPVVGGLQGRHGAAVVEREHIPKIVITVSN